MSKIGTMYNESERLITLKHLDTYGLNPFAFWTMMQTYINKIHPMPVKWDYEMQRKDKMDQVSQNKKMVTLHIETAGYLGKKRGDASKLDVVGANLFCRSYYEQLRPMPVTFQIMNAITVHLRTPGEPDRDALNPMRSIYDPTK
jgi:hypothetical protein